MVNSLLVLLEEAIIPASLIFLTKVFSMLVLNAVLSLSWTIKEKAVWGTFPSIEYQNFDHFFLANSYSNLITFIVVFLGTSLVVLRGHFFHPHHMHPRNLARLLSSRLSFLISDSLRIYHQGLVWLLIFYSFSFFLTLQGAYGFSFLWFSLLSFFLSNILAVLYLWDIWREMESKKVKDRDIRHSYFPSRANPVDNK